MTGCILYCSCSMHTGTPACAQHHASASSSFHSSYTCEAFSTEFMTSLYLSAGVLWLRPQQSLHRYIARITSPLPE